MRISVVSVSSFALVAMLAAGCGGKDGEGGGAAAIPAKPSNGSPISAEFVGFGDSDGERTIKARLYNHGDKTAVGYVIIARYYDADDKLMKVKPGTPFEKDTDFMSLSGNKYKCEAKKSAKLEIDMMAVPAEAKRAELLVSKVSSLAADGMKIEDWWSQDRWSEWPATPAADAPAE